jgi:hypothetical protein
MGYCGKPDPPSPLVKGGQEEEGRKKKERRRVRSITFQSPPSQGGFRGIGNVQSLYRIQSPVRIDRTS